MKNLTPYGNWDKVKNLLRNFTLMIACYFLFFMLLRVIDIFVFGLDFNKYEQIEIFETLKEQPWKFVFLAVIAAPVIEESIFRSLIKPSVNSLKLFLCAVFYMIGIALMPEEGHWALRYSLLFGIIILAYYAISELIPPRIFLKVSSWLNKYYLLIWILGAIVFGFVHIFNYVETFQMDLVLFMMIFPRIIAGFFFGKIKIENQGMIWPILMHSMNNSIVLIFLLPYALSQY
ncbi:CPBP family glutamic-type intramembrane protease [Gramella jeungdoensis]|uniref:CPBP family glutamic-type intramembrane protease n=1 Tax=Gramella jeungdoensis TaxID=708091 RepID=A0ABT0Z488_9FLAO|nr:CPBP family glutamic-type intramembrane protease [Gramella jeungdoensis]MCM8570557.1 CPBP family glutamic-type intramembrane protease [Gramella jeungdoensis]